MHQKPARMRLAWCGHSTDRRRDGVGVVGQDGADAPHVLGMAWRFGWACSSLLENAIAACRGDAPRQAVGLGQSDTILTEHGETFSFCWHKAGVSLARART